MSEADVLVVGGGPAGLSAAAAAARKGVKATVVEQDPEIGSPARTSGGSFIKDLQALGIPSDLYHPIRRVRFSSPGSSVTFEYKSPSICVMDVRRVFQFLAGRAADAGAQIQVATHAIEPIVERDRVVGMRLRDVRRTEHTVNTKVVIDATGYKATIAKRAGLFPGFRRFGVGAEYDLYAPHYDQDEAVLLVGGEVAPAGYAWAFPWGSHRVRVGAGVLHGDVSDNPTEYLEKLMTSGDRVGLDLRRAQPVEYHFGLIPAEGLAPHLAGDGIMVAGDAGGQPSALAGEGIRWAIWAGDMAGSVAANAVVRGDYSRASLAEYEKQWNARHGRNLRIAYAINRKIARWTDEKWDRGVDWLRLFSSDQFTEALRANFMATWGVQLLATHPTLMRKGLEQVVERLLRKGGEERPTSTQVRLDGPSTEETTMGRS